MDSLSYEISRLDNAIEKVSGVIEKYSDHPHAYQYYTAMQECLFALRNALDEAQLIHIRQHKIENDIAVLKHLFLKYVKEEKSCQ